MRHSHRVQIRHPICAASGGDRKVQNLADELPGVVVEAESMRFQRRIENERAECEVWHERLAKAPQNRCSIAWTCDSVSRISGPPGREIPPRLFGPADVRKLIIRSNLERLEVQDRRIIGECETVVVERATPPPSGGMRASRNLTFRGEITAMSGRSRSGFRLEVGSAPRVPFGAGAFVNEGVGTHAIRPEPFPPPRPDGIRRPVGAFPVWLHAGPGATRRRDPGPGLHFLLARGRRLVAAPARGEGSHRCEGRGDDGGLGIPGQPRPAGGTGRGLPPDRAGERRPPCGQDEPRRVRGLGVGGERLFRDAKEPAEPAAADHSRWLVERVGGRGGGRAGGRGLRHGLGRVGAGAGGLLRDCRPEDDLRPCLARRCLPGLARAPRHGRPPCPGHGRAG